MRTIGKWMIWLGGLALLYLDLRPIFDELQQAYRDGHAVGPYTPEEWMRRFARPVFVLGVMCAAALPDLTARRAKRRSAAAVPPVAPSAPAPAAAPAPPETPAPPPEPPASAL